MLTSEVISKAAESSSTGSSFPAGSAPSVPLAVVSLDRAGRGALESPARHSLDDEGFVCLTVSSSAGLRAESRCVSIRRDMRCFVLIAVSRCPSSFERLLRPGHSARARCLCVPRPSRAGPSRGGRSLAFRRSRGFGTGIPWRALRPVVFAGSARLLSCLARCRSLGLHVGA
ncbi:UNVERIFIED_CONTAM: hypothetical protein Sindi_3140700 [Sesamum indicum]